jgi:hypothetical protein
MILIKMTITKLNTESQERGQNPKVFVGIGAVPSGLKGICLLGENFNSSDCNRP